MKIRNLWRLASAVFATLMLAGVLFIPAALAATSRNQAHHDLTNPLKSSICCGDYDTAFTDDSTASDLSPTGVVTWDDKITNEIGSTIVVNLTKLIISPDYGTIYSSSTLAGVSISAGNTYDFPASWDTTSPVCGGNVCPAEDGYLDVIDITETSPNTYSHGDWDVFEIAQTYLISSSGYHCYVAYHKPWSVYPIYVRGSVSVTGCYDAVGDPYKFTGTVYTHLQKNDINYFGSSHHMANSDYNKGFTTAVYNATVKTAANLEWDYRDPCYWTQGSVSLVVQGTPQSGGGNSVVFKYDPNACTP